MATTTPVRAGALTMPSWWVWGSGLGQALSVVGNGLGPRFPRALSKSRPQVRRTGEPTLEAKDPSDVIDRPPLARSHHVVLRDPDDRAGRHDRERRAPGHCRRPRVLPEWLVLGGQRLPD